jgi:hypothetical protein
MNPGPTARLSCRQDRSGTPHDSEDLQAPCEAVSVSGYQLDSPGRIVRGEQIRDLRPLAPRDPSYPARRPSDQARTTAYSRCTRAGAS